MTTTAHLHTDHQLDQLAAQFEHWRQHRAHPRERIPKALWDQAVVLTETLAPSRVATHLGLGVTDLKKTDRPTPTRTRSERRPAWLCRTPTHARIACESAGL